MHSITKLLIAVVMLYPTSVLATAVVRIDTGIEKINALEATLVLPVSMRVSRVETGSSAILVWITPPRLDAQKIVLSGITPGGFSGVQPIFTIQGEFERKDLERVMFTEVLALKSDGSGGSVPVTFSLVLGESQYDTEPPEDFMPAIASDKNVFDGKTFLVFATQDKGSGVARYRVCEGLFGRCEQAQSPYVLRYQGGDRAISVQASDFSGNTRTTYLYTSAAKMRYGLYTLFGIVSSMATLFFFLYRRSILPRM